MKRIATLLVLAVACAGLAFAGVRDLPVKRAGGKEYYYYKVQKGESVAGIAKALGIGSEEIVRHNPRAAGGVDRKTTLFFPVGEYAPVAAAPDEESAPKPALPALRAAIVLALPLGLDKAEPTRANGLALDFYKGFLIAADTLSRRSGDVEIIVLDSESPGFEQRLADDDVATAAVAVAPGDTRVLARMAALAQERGSWLLNVFDVPDSLYAVNTQVLQANVPQKYMYSLAADAFVSSYDGYTPVILRSTAGRSEKEPFLTYLCLRLAQKGVIPAEISYDQSLLSSDLEFIVPGGKYVFLTNSGDAAQFNKFAYVLDSYRTRLTAQAAAAAEAYAAGEEGAVPLPDTEMALFGYPDWMVFRGDALDMLHRLGAKVYSRFFDNFNSFDARALEAAFHRWYGCAIIESVPSQATLGYDTGCYLIKNLRANGGIYNPLSPGRFSGLQSTFDFDRYGDAGYYNSTLYIIDYLPGDAMSSRTL